MESWTELAALIRVELASRAEGASPDAELWARVEAAVEQVVVRALSREADAVSIRSDVAQWLLLELQDPKFVERLVKRDANEGYLVVAARNRARSLQRKDRATERLAARSRYSEPALVMTPEAMERRGEMAWLEAVLARLPPEARELFWLRFGEQLTLEEIGERLSIPRSAAAQRLFRAMKRLRSELGGKPVLEGKRST